MSTTGYRINTQDGPFQTTYFSFDTARKMFEEWFDENEESHRGDQLEIVGWQCYRESLYHPKVWYARVIHENGDDYDLDKYAWVEETPIVGELNLYGIYCIDHGPTELTYCFTLNEVRSYFTQLAEDEARELEKPVHFQGFHYPVDDPKTLIPVFNNQIDDYWRVCLVKVEVNPRY